MIDPKQTNTNKFLILPFLPVVFFFLRTLNNYKELIFTKKILLVLIVYAILPIVIYTIIKKLGKLSTFQAIFSSTLIVVFLLFFGPLQDFLFQFNQYPFLSNSILLILLFILTMVIFLFRVRKKNIALVKPVKYLLLLFSIFISIEIIELALVVYRGKTIHSLSRNMNSGILEEQKMEGMEKPDIHHIIFDSYSSPVTLKEHWNFENDIVPFLNSKGFYTVDSGFSNYISTPFSISSIFNLEYLDGAGPYLYSNSPNFYIGQRVYKKNSLFQYLKNNGYQFSIFSQLENEELMIGLGFLGVKPPDSWVRKQTIERIYLNPWMTSKLNRLFVKSDNQPDLILESMQSFNEHNKLALDHIISVCQNSKSSSPLFSFTHIMIPHDPYLMDENGKFVESPQPGGYDMSRYLGQVKYSNKLIKQIADCLLKDSSRKKIIIFQGDHGFRHYENAKDDAPFGALNAIYFYNKNYKGLRKNISHVNTYRVVINNVFGGHLPLLKDSIFFLDRD